MAKKDDKGKNPQNRTENKKRGLPEAAKPYMFKPGQSGNPGGRPKKTLLTDAIEEMLEEKLSDPAARQAFKEAHWKKLLSATVVSSMTLEKILDRTEGKVSQPVQVSGELTVSLSDEIRKARLRAEAGEQEQE